MITLPNPAGVSCNPCARNPWNAAPSTRAKAIIQPQALRPEGCGRPCAAAHATNNKPAGRIRRQPTSNGGSIVRVFIATMLVPQKAKGDTSIALDNRLAQKLGSSSCNGSAGCRRGNARPAVSSSSPTKHTTLSSPLETQVSSPSCLPCSTSSVVELNSCLVPDAVVVLDDCLQAKGLLCHSRGGLRATRDCSADNSGHLCRESIWDKSGARHVVYVCQRWLAWRVFAVNSPTMHCIRTRLVSRRRLA
mmetsp:Transcript_886/g.1324  ORF Transcript_886/g.1324 Transcript_886/m.1324 type:complete len:248 (-) Transcript_886:29-772(-)